MKKLVFRYLLSSLDTFLSGFAIGVYGVLQPAQIHDLTTLKAVLIAAATDGVFAGVRLCFKAAREMLKAYIDRTTKI